jgi:hypothetical protein
VTPEPYRLSSSQPDVDAGERQGIFGLETEYSILYFPDDPQDLSRPDFSHLQALLFSHLLALRKAASSAGLKGGYFLQNGGLVHLEAYVRSQGDTPVLEAATPECRSPWDLAVYSRAFDALLVELSSRITESLREGGFRGRVVFAKNNLDARGVGYGCHENYLVRHRVSRVDKALFCLGLPPVLLCLLPAVLLLIAVLTAIGLAYLLARVFPTLRRIASRLYRGVSRRRWLVHNLLGLYYVASSVLLFPAIFLYARLIRLLAFRPFLRDLTAFVVTRQIVAGTGNLNFAERCFELSQRSALTSSVADIVMFGLRKTMFDLKGLLYEPLALFRPLKKMTLTIGDSTLSDVSTLLKLGPTALLIEMVESGASFADLRLKNPVRAFHEVSLGGPWKRLRLRNGGEMSAVEIQREYLRRVREHFAGRRPGRLRHDDILDLWEECLLGLEDRPQGLADSLDWAAKKALLDSVILPVTTWKTFFAWGHVFQLAGARATQDAQDPADLVERAPTRTRWRLRRALRDPTLRGEDFSALRELYFQARKVDLRFHELSEEGGYQRQIEREGLMRRLTDDEDVLHATREPPQDTRARIRGYYIRLSPSPESLQVNWGEIEFLSPSRHIALPDPFFHRLPGDT